MINSEILKFIFRKIGFRPESGETLEKIIDNSIGQLEKWHIYKIDNITIGDDFSNCSEVLSGTINTQGCIFQAISEIPLMWNTAILADITLVYSSENKYINDIAGVSIETVKKSIEIDPVSLLPRKSVFQYLIEVLRNESLKALQNFVLYSRNRLQLKEEKKPIVTGYSLEEEIDIDCTYIGYHIIPKYLSIVSFKAIYMQVENSQEVQFFLYQRGKKTAIQYISANLNAGELSIIPLNWTVPSIDEYGNLIEYYVIIHIKKEDTDPIYFLDPENIAIWYNVDTSFTIEAIYNTIRKPTITEIYDKGNYSTIYLPFSLIYSVEWDYTEFFNMNMNSMLDIITYTTAIRIITDALYSNEFNQITESNRKQWENMILYFKNELYGYQFTDKDGNVGRQFGLMDNVFNLLQNENETIFPKQRKMTI